MAPYPHHSWTYENAAHVAIFRHSTQTDWSEVTWQAITCLAWLLCAFNLVHTDYTIYICLQRLHYITSTTIAPFSWAHYNLIHIWDLFWNSPHWSTGFKMGWLDSCKVKGHTRALRGEPGNEARFAIWAVSLEGLSAMRVHLQQGAAGHKAHDCCVVQCIKSKKMTSTGWKPFIW